MVHSETYSTFRTRIAKKRKKWKYLFLVVVVLLLLCFHIQYQVYMYFAAVSIYCCCCFVVLLPSWWIDLLEDGREFTASAPAAVRARCWWSLEAEACETVCVLCGYILTAAVATWEICGGPSFSLSHTQVYKWDEWYGVKGYIGLH